jgi:predicted dehydrogenase
MSHSRPSPVLRGTPLTRRQALARGLTGILAGATAPLFFRGRLLGADAPSNRIGVGIVGNGLISRSHVGALVGRTDCRIRALCDVWSKPALEVQARIGESYGEGDKPVVFARHEELLARPDIDAVFVCTPDHWHAPVSNAALRAGKDVYCEKPLTLTVQEGRVLVDSARRHGRVFQTGTQQRSETAFRRAATMVRNGWIGDVVGIRTSLGEFPLPRVLDEQPVPADLDYDRWLGPTPWRPYHPERIRGDYGGGWRVYWEYGGRKNGDWGAHHFDIIQWALGMDQSGPVEFVPKGWQGTPWQTHRYANGVTVERVNSVPRGMIEFRGSRGTIWVGRGAVLETDPVDLVHRIPRAEEVELYASTDHHTDFFNCVRSRQRPISDVEVGHRSASACHLNNIAETLQRPVRWDPAREEIVGDPVASRLLERPRRAPYGLL